MSSRLDRGGRRVTRGTPVRFTFDGRRYTGMAGDTLASALLANGVTLMGRSFKYHRPRGVVASGTEEPNALANLGTGGRFEPNARMSTAEIYEGLEATSQNRWPSLQHDVGVVNDALSRFLPAGFYYKTFKHPRSFWKHVYEPFIRHSAGLGRAPEAESRDADTYEQFHTHVDLLVAGGGIAGLAAALAAGQAGKSVLLMEQSPAWGGRAVVDGVEIEGKPAGDWVAATVAELSAMPHVDLRLRSTVTGLYDHGYALAAERLTDHAPRAGAPRQRLWKIRAGQVITATGAIERPLAFAGNDRPGVMLASAVRDYLADYAVSPGDRTVIVTNNDDAYRTAFALREAGLEVPLILDARANPDGPLVRAARDRGFRVEAGRGIAKVKGGKHVTGVAVCAQAGEGAVLEEIACDAVAMSGGWSPVVHLWSQAGGKLVWDEAEAAFRPDPDRPPTGASGEATVTPAGIAAGAKRSAEVMASAWQAAGGAGEAPRAEDAEEGALQPVWLMPQGASYALRSKAFLDFQNDVKVSDVELAAREGFESVEHAKRYTTLGMATDQGKLSNINGLAILSRALHNEIPQTGTTTFRPPYTPLTMATIAGASRGDLFQPVRQTPMSEWHAANHADFEPVGQWRRPYAYPQAEESLPEAVSREVRNTRQNVGLLDASTLGKILVAGPDAGQFLDMIYTGKPSTIPVGRCRYGLMCNENGFLMDDGVVVRLSEDQWLCHTTSGGADHVHGHMEDWLQCEWWDWKVHTVNQTEQWAQVAVAGPKARDLLASLTDLDLSKEALPFMSYAEGTVAGLPARVFRISFSGELGFEVAVPAAQGRLLWDALREAGRAHGAMPYGTEALHVMRAEKGFIMIGDETDGTVTPQDLNLGWAISRKKDDYIGKRAQERSHLTDPTRWRLVGLETVGGDVLEDGAYVLAPGHNALGQRNLQGRVTSTYYSPTLDRGIAMALVKRGPERMGEIVEVSTMSGQPMAARICDPVFYDKAGERQDV